jgi:hypothetical protein
LALLGPNVCGIARTKSNSAESGTAHAYDQSAEEAGWQAEPHRINLALEPVDFLKGIHRRKIEQAEQSEAHFRKQAARVQSREA